MPKARGARRPRFRFLPTVVLTVAILGLPTVVYAWGRSSASFDVKHVAVVGTALVPEKRALRVLRREYRGRNLFTVTAADVSKTLAPFCFVSRVSIDRDFPDTLRITVVEHVPVAYGLTGDRWYVVAADGHLICGAGESASNDADAPLAADASPLPSPSPGATAEGTAGVVAAQTGAADDRLTRLIAGPAGPEFDLPRVELPRRAKAGTTLRGEQSLTTLRVVGALPRPLRERLDAIRNDEGRLTLWFAGGPVVQWGDEARTAAKSVALRVVLAEYDSSGTTCTYIDVSMPDRVLAKPVLK